MKALPFFAYVLMGTLAARTDCNYGKSIPNHSTAVVLEILRQIDSSESDFESLFSADNQSQAFDAFSGLDTHFRSLHQDPRRHHCYRYGYQGRYTEENEDQDQYRMLHLSPYIT